MGNNIMLHIYDHEIMCVTENKEEMYIHLTLTLHIGMSDGYSNGSLVKHHLKKMTTLYIDCIPAVPGM